jgi:tRNA pseudouridine65 synthase
MPLELAPPSPLLRLTVLYRDAALLVVDKPAGLIVHRGWARDDITALTLAREIAGQWVYPVHRLDRSTSGVLVFALSPDVAALVEELFAAEQVEKRYVALVRGLSPEALLIEHPLAKDKDKPKVPSATRVARLESYYVEDAESGIARRYSWVEAFPLTGRPHQIRRHLRHIDHPIIGDVRYGKAQHNRMFRRRFALERTALHAERVRLPHPITRVPLEVVAPLSDDLRNMLDSLGQLPQRPLDGSPHPVPVSNNRPP